MNVRKINFYGSSRIQKRSENINYKKFDVTACGLDNNNEFYIYSDSLEYLNDGSWINCSSNKKINNINEFIFINSKKIILAPNKLTINNK